MKEVLNHPHFVGKTAELLRMRADKLAQLAQSFTLRGVISKDLVLVITLSEMNHSHGKELCRRIIN